MFSRNNLALGMLYGAIIPGIAWLLFACWLNNEAVIMNKPAAPYLTALFLNLLLLRYVAKRHLYKTANGIMITTFVCMLLIFMLKMQVSV